MTQSLSDFYVYEHWRPDAGSCFYVGKGRGKRSRLLGVERNPHHQRIVAKLKTAGLSVDVKIVQEGMTEEAAYLLEMNRIALWKDRGIVLANMTMGGDGLRSPSASVRKKMSAAHELRWTPERRLKMSEQSKKRWESNDFRLLYAEKRRGIPWSEQMRSAMAGKHKGQEMGPEARARHFGEGNPFFGKKHTEETRKKIREARAKQITTKATRAKMSASRKGRKKSPEHIAKMIAGRAITMLLKKLRETRERV